MLIFRRISNKKAKCTLELRHQRTCDVCFDWAITNEDLAYKSLDNKDDVQNEKLDKLINESDPINSDGIIRSD